jgi:hypothetical protein
MGEVHEQQNVMTKNVNFKKAFATKEGKKRKIVYVSVLVAFCILIGLVASVILICYTYKEFKKDKSNPLLGHCFKFTRLC